MKKPIQLSKLFLSFVLLSFLLTSIGCQKKESSAQQEEKPEVLVSIPPYAYFVQKIAGDTLSVQSVVPPGSDLHTFEPTAKDVHKFTDTALWIGIGENFERRIVETLYAQNEGMVSLNLSEYIPLSPHPNTLGVCLGLEQQKHRREAAMDLHFWMSPKLAPLQAQLIARALIEVNPEKKHLYLANLKKFMEELTDLDDELEKKFSSIKGAAFLVSHPSLGYFCKDYGLYQISVECEGKAPKPKDLQTIMELAKEHHVRCLLMQANLPYKGASLIAKKLKIPSYDFDPYARNYMENIKKLAKIIYKSYQANS